MVSALLVQFPANMLGKEAKDVWSACATITEMGAPDEMDPWLRPGPVAALADLWGSGPADGRALSVPPTLPFK